MRADRDVPYVIEQLCALPAEDDDGMPAEEVFTEFGWTSPSE